MKMKREMTLFHTMRPSRNVLFQANPIFVTIHGLMWSSFNTRWCSCAPMWHWLHDITLSSDESAWNIHNSHNIPKWQPRCFVARLQHFVVIISMRYDVMYLQHWHFRCSIPHPIAVGHSASAYFFTIVPLQSYSTCWEGLCVELFWTIIWEDAHVHWTIIPSPKEVITLCPQSWWLITHLSAKLSGQISMK